jgi:hypothetical protein
VDLPGSASTPAKQSIPPRVRREVSLRHGKRCALPGCRHAAFVELHHSLVALCDGHHTAFKEREAQRMIDCAKSHVRRDATVEDAVRVALRQAPLPVGVREELASYERIVA